ncbi:MAG: hypothetical protein WCT18_00715 [Patescibacteria group bacterium]
MNKFTLFWSDGKRQVVEGKDFADACLRAGIQQGAFFAMDFMDNGDIDSHEFINGKWYKRKDLLPWILAGGMSVWTLYYLTGKKQRIVGVNFSDACRRAKLEFDQDLIAVLVEKDDNSYQWDGKKWQKK